jgi:hypothetical protein
MEAILTGTSLVAFFVAAVWVGHKWEAYASRKQTRTRLLRLVGMQD